MNRTIPAVSITIPMYNAEKYIGECLDSILAQTFNDYEVIVVNDCSTDKSCEIVESYISKFGGRLRLIHMEKNSGSGAAPRNMGLRLSRGDYVFFMDNDDTIVNDALEVLYNVAKKFNADVVHCDKYFKAEGETATTDKSKLEPFIKSRDVEVPAPTFLTSEIAKRIDIFLTWKMRWEPWSNFIRRDFLSFNNLAFPNLSIADDLVLNVELLCLAKNFVLLPDAFYVWRQRPDSTNHNFSSSVSQVLHKKVGDFFGEVHFLGNFMNNLEFFSQHPEYKDKIFHFMASQEAAEVVPIYAKIPAWKFEKLIRQEVDKVEDKATLATFLFARMNLFHSQLIQSKNLLRQQAAQINELQRQLAAK